MNTPEIDTPNKSSKWLVFGDSNTAQLSKKLEESLNNRIASAGITQRDIEYVAKLRRDLCPNGLNVDSERLELLRRLCQNWDLELKPSKITSHRPFVGPLIVVLKRFMFPILRFLMKETIKQQRDFNLTVIELLSNLADQRSIVSDRKA